MFNFFQSLMEIISSVFSFIINSINATTELFINAVEGLSFITFAFSYMPAFLLPFLLALLSIAIVKFILNMGGN